MSIASLRYREILYDADNKVTSINMQVMAGRGAITKISAEQCQLFWNAYANDMNHKINDEIQCINDFELLTMGARRPTKELLGIEKTLSTMKACNISDDTCSDNFTHIENGTSSLEGQEDNVHEDDIDFDVSTVYIFLLIHLSENCACLSYT